MQLSPGRNETLGRGVRVALPGLTLSSQWGRPCLPPAPLPGQSPWSLRRGEGAPTGRVRPAPSQKPGGRTGRWLCSGARWEARDWLWVPHPGGAGGLASQLPFLCPPSPLGSVSVSSGGEDGSKLGPASRPCLDLAGKQEVGRLHTAGEGPLERHGWAGAGV